MQITFRPFTDEVAALRHAAALCGVETEYHDIWGRHHVVDAAVVRSILETLGIACGSLELLNQSIDDHLWREWSRIAPPTVVAFADSAVIPVSLEVGRAEAVSATFHWEDGSSETLEVPVDQMPADATAELRGRHFVRRQFPVPPHAPLGYHTVAIDNHTRVNLILCPRRAYLPAPLENGKKAAGIAVSLYGLRSDRNWGCGDFTDLANLVEWAAHNGLGFVALNPLHSIPNRQPYNTSPYLPTSILYRNILYLDVTQLGIGEPAEAAMLRSNENVEYEKVYKLKRKALRAAFRRFLGDEWSRDTEFRAYLEREGQSLRSFATYCALDEWLHREDPNLWLWTDWPPEYRDPASPAVAEFAQKHWRMVLFYQFAQWHVDRQLAAVQARARALRMPIGLYHDLALAIDRTGSDAWSYPGFYMRGCRVGSPPDDFAPDGQDWAFPPPDSRRHFESGYRLFAEGIRKTARHGGALRIDHVMRLFRLFWIPDGKKASEGAYVKDRAGDLLKILALESVRQQMLIVGEDLGTVSDETRAALLNYGILSYRLFFFEKHWDGSFKAPSEYPAQAISSTTTHDLPTLAGFWSGNDIEVREAVGLIRDAESKRSQIAGRLEEKRKMAAALGLDASFAEATELPDEVLDAVIGFLASTPCLLFVLNQEDLTRSKDQLNVPGTTHEHPNWRRKMKYTVAELDTNEEALRVLAMLRKWIEKTGRLQG